MFASIYPARLAVAFKALGYFALSEFKSTSAYLPGSETAGILSLPARISSMTPSTSFLTSAGILLASSAPAPLLTGCGDQMGVTGFSYSIRTQANSSWLCKLYRYCPKATKIDFEYVARYDRHRRKACTGHYYLTRQQRDTELRQLVCKPGQCSAWIAKHIGA